MGLGMKELPTPRKIFNIDNTTINQGRSRTTLIWMYTLKESTRKCGSSSLILEVRIFF
jgi:hypothetical protein